MSDELIEIGKKINKAIMAVKSVGLTPKEISEFEEFIVHQETIQPLMNPTSFNRTSKMIDMAKERPKVLKPIINLEEK